MRDTKEIIFKPTYSGIPQKLLMSADQVEFYKSLTDKHPFKFTKSEVFAMRFGIKALRDFGFSIGRIYCIDIKNNEGRVIKLRLTSKYKIRLQEQKKKYSEIINSVFSYYFSDAVINYMRMFKHHQNFSILNVLISPEGITLKEGTEFIKWIDVDSKLYTTYYALSSKPKPALFQTFYYAEDWNVLLLFNVIKQILKLKNLLRK